MAEIWLEMVVKRQIVSLLFFVTPSMYLQMYSVSLQVLTSRREMRWDIKKLFLRAEFRPLWEPWEEDETPRKVVLAGSSVLNEVIGYIEDQTGRSDINWATALENCVYQKGSQKLDDCIRDTLNHHEKKTENLIPGNIGKEFFHNICKYFNSSAWGYKE